MCILGTVIGPTRSGGLPRLLIFKVGATVRLLETRFQAIQFLFELGRIINEFLSSLLELFFLLGPLNR